MSATATCDSDVASFAVELLDEGTDVGQLCEAAFAVDAEVAWRAVADVAAAALEGTTSRSRGATREHRLRGLRIVRTLLANPHTPPEVSAAAVEAAHRAGCDHEFVYPAFLNERLAPQVIEAIYRCWGSVYGSELTHPNTPVSVLAASIRVNPDAAALEGIVERDRLPVELQRALAGSSPEIRRRLARRADLDPELYELLMDGEGLHDARVDLAANPALPVEVLERLAGDDERAVRAAVARNPAAPDRVLIALLDGSDPDVVGTAFMALRARGVIAVPDA